KVPPTARQRMYGLIKGRESSPYRKARVAAVGAEKAGGEVGSAGTAAEADETLLLGLRPSGWVPWVVAAAGAIVLLGVLVLVVYQALSRDDRGPVAKGGSPSDEQPSMEELPPPVEEQSPEEKKPAEEKKGAENGAKPSDGKPAEEKKPATPPTANYLPSM